MLEHNWIKNSLNPTEEEKTLWRLMGSSPRRIFITVWPLRLDAEFPTQQLSATGCISFTRPEGPMLKTSKLFFPNGTKIFICRHKSNIRNDSFDYPRYILYRGWAFVANLSSPSY